MKRVIAAAGICFLATVCFAQEKYHNSKWHFSFTVPEGWEVITDETVLDNYTKMFETRFEYAEVLALCRKAGSEGKKSSILVQARPVGEAKEGLSLETVYEEQLRSNIQWNMSTAYLKDFRNDLMKQGEIDKETKFESYVYYDPNRHIFFETTSLPIKSGGAIGISTLRLLGSNKAIILSFKAF
jgi:hypothetical protein